MISRRRLLQAGGAALAFPAIKSFADALPQEVLGFHNAPMGGIARHDMMLLQGTAPAELKGALYRNGPAHFWWGNSMTGHWFDGDGLVRAFRFAGGKLSLDARFVATKKRRTEVARKGFVMSGFGTKAALDAGIAGPDDANAANTSVLAVGDDIWALWEAGSPYGLDPKTLETKGPLTLGEGLKHMPFSAHPKVDGKGHIWNFGTAYGFPNIFLWQLDPSGKVVKAELVDLPRDAYLHDWAVTDSKLIIPLQPWRMKKPGSPIVQHLNWQPEEGMLVVVIDKNDFSKKQVFELPPGFFFHTGNAMDMPDGSIVFDVCMSNAPTLDAADGERVVRGQPSQADPEKAALITLKANGGYEIEQTPFIGEFPKSTRTGKLWKMFAAAAGKDTPRGSSKYNAVMSIDWNTGDHATFDFGAEQLTEEPMLAADSVGKNWLLVPTLNLRAKASELHIFEPDHLASGPVASWRANTALPLGFHGTWVQT